MLLEADGSQLSSFVAGFRPMRFSDGWGIVTPTSDHDFAGMCRALDVDGYDDPRVATIGERMTNREVTAEIVARCYTHAESRSMADASARFDAERVPFAMILSPPSSPTIRTRSRSGCSSSTTITSSGRRACPAIPRSSARPRRH